MVEKKRLPPVPKPRKSKAAKPAGAGAAADRPPDLAHIAEQLRALAVPVGELNFDPANARVHDDKNLDAIRGSLAVYGQVKPVVVRRDTHTVVAGNGTLQAALSLGWTHIAAVYVAMDAATAAGFSIADNRSAELASWDKDALDTLLREANTGNDERLDAMLAELAADVGLVPADDADKKATSEGGEGRTNVDARIICPECGHEFTR